MSTNSRQKFDEPIVTKLMRRIQKTEDCWLWQPKGGRYGSFYHKGKSSSAHRAVYKALVGEIPEGLVIDHLCGNTYCVNPEHLEPTTQAINVHRAPTHVGNRTHCPQGHEYSIENTNRSCKRRKCLTCHRDREAVRRLMLRSKSL